MFEFKRYRRLITAKHYRRVFHHRHQLVTSAFVVLHLQNHCDYSRLGLAISRKHVNRAVIRNKIKRIIREHFRLQQPLPSVDIVVVSRPNLSRCDNIQCREQLSAVWEKLIDFYSKASCS